MLADMKNLDLGQFSIECSIAYISNGFNNNSGPNKHDTVEPNNNSIQ